MSAAESFEDLVRRIVRITLAEQQHLNTPKFFSQDSPPPGMSKRTYLDHCYKGTWPNVKHGRLRVTSAADYEAWRNLHPVRAAKQREAVEHIEDEAAYVANGGRRSRR